MNAAASRVTTLLATWLLTTNGLLAAPGIAIAADIQQPLQSGRFSTLYEPSGVVVLNASLAIVIEDEMAKPLRQLHLTSDNASSELSIQERSMASAGSFWKRQKLGPLDDLEGIAHLSETQFIVVGSHDDATRKSHSLRQKLVLFTLENQQVDDVRLNRDLYTHIINAYPELAKKLRKSGKSDGHELNIEALAYDRKRDYLLIGLRSPTLDSNAVIVTILNPQAYMLGTQNPRFSQPLQRLDLDKGGIRALSYDDKSDTFLIISRRESGNKQRFKLWSMAADGSHTARRIRSQNKTLFDNVEGISAIDNGFLFVRDNGLRSQKQGAGWFTLNRQQLGLD